MWITWYFSCPLCSAPAPALVVEFHVSRRQTGWCETKLRPSPPHSTPPPPQACYPTPPHTHEWPGSIKQSQPLYGSPINGLKYGWWGGRLIFCLFEWVREIRCKVKLSWGATVTTLQPPRPLGHVLVTFVTWFDGQYHQNHWSCHNLWESHFMQDHNKRNIQSDTCLLCSRCC